MGSHTAEKAEVGYYSQNKTTTILFFPATLTPVGLMGPGSFLMLLVQHLGHVVFLLLLDLAVRYMIPAMEPAVHGLGWPRAGTSVLVLHIHQQPPAWPMPLT